MKEEFVYVLFSKDSGLHKIGKSDNPFRRVADLTTQLKQSIKVVACVAVKDARKTELFLHNEFKDRAVCGEWFRFNNQDFLTVFWKACSNNLELSGYYTSPTHIVATEDKEFEEFVDTHYIISAKYAFSVFNNKYPGSATIPMKLKKLGCKKINIKGISHYVTIAGQQLGLHNKCDAEYKRSFINVKMKKEG